MRGLIARLLGGPDAEAAALREEVAALQSRLRIAQLEVTLLAEVVARDRKRVEAETAALAAQVANGRKHE